MKENLYYLATGIVIAIAIMAVWLLVVEPAEVGPGKAVGQEKQIASTEETPKRSERESFVVSVAPPIVEPAKIASEKGVRQEKQVATTEEAPKRSELESFMASAAPLAAEFRSMRNAWAVGISVEDHHDAILRLMNARDIVELVPNNSLVESMMTDTAKAINAHRRAVYYWQMAIDFPERAYYLGAKRNRIIGEGLQYGGAFLAAYKANK